MKHFTVIAVILAGSLISRAEPEAFERGAPIIDSTPEQHCGVMLGGIGAGCLELWPDGCFHDWYIFNRGRWGYRGDHLALNKQDRLALPEMNADALQFFIRTRSPDGHPIARRLGTNGEQMNVYSYNTWMQNVARIRYDATFPGATLKYEDPDLPVEITGRFFSPIIPHDLKTSGTPGTYMVFTIRNTSRTPQEVSLATYLRNPVARGGDAAHRGAEIRKLRTTIAREKDATYLTMRTDAGDLPFSTTIGSLSLSISGGEPSWIATDFGEFLNGRTLALKPWNQRFETPLRWLRFDGKLPNTDPQPCPTTIGALKVGGARPPNTQDLPQDVALGESQDLAKLTDAQVAEIISEARKIASLKSVIEQAEAVDPTLLDPARNGRALVDILRQAIAQYAGEDGKAANWGDGMLCSNQTLQPGEERQVRLALAWHFPNHPSPKQDRNMGHMYNHWFKDAEEVNRFLTSQYASLNERVEVFHGALRQSNLPYDLRAALSSQLNTLICSSWWTEDDKMGMWEGFGTIGQNTVDVAYQGSHPITSLFPEWAKNWTRLATTYQNQTTGRLYHSLPGDMNVGNKNSGYGYVDVNCHFVLMLTRDYLWFGDRDYLKFYYPHVAKEIGVFEALDGDGDGLPDQHTNSNTYDTWDLEGTPSYLSSIWIGALRGAIRMAEDSGDTANAAKWNALLQKALQSFDGKLWNGEYYSLWIQGDLRDEACMTDQLSGEMYTKLIGLGNALPVERVKKALAAIYKYNFTPEQGLFNGTYPPGRKPHMPTYRNVQGEGNWTGIEYAAAAMMIDQGLVEEGLSIVKAVGRRYMRAGRFFNHEECGPHYYRPLSIWATFLAATGFKVDAPRGILTIAPPLKQPEVLAPWVSATGFGQFKRTASAFELTCRDGATTFRELRVNVEGVKTATLDGKLLTFKAKTENGLSALQFDEPLTLKAGQTLMVK